MRSEHVDSESGRKGLNRFFSYPCKVLQSRSERLVIFSGRALQTRLSLRPSWIHCICSGQRHPCGHLGPREWGILFWTQLSGILPFLLLQCRLLSPSLAFLILTIIYFIYCTKLSNDHLSLSLILSYPESIFLFFLHSLLPSFSPLLVSFRLLSTTHPLYLHPIPSKSGREMNG